MRLLNAVQSKESQRNAGLLFSPSFHRIDCLEVCIECSYRVGTLSKLRTHCVDPPNTRYEIKRGSLRDHNSRVQNSEIDILLSALANTNEREIEIPRPESLRRW